MGTNYYALSPACEAACAHCSAAREIHLCKSLVMFEAHEESPWGPIGSWADWKRILRTHLPIIRDEYGKEHSLAAFIGGVELTSPENRRRQYDYAMAHSAGREPGWDYLDADGFSWTRSEFS